MTRIDPHGVWTATRDNAPPKTHKSASIMGLGSVFSWKKVTDFSGNQCHACTQAHACTHAHDSGPKLGRHAPQTREAVSLSLA